MVRRERNEKNEGFTIGVTSTSRRSSSSSSGGGGLRVLGHFQ